MDDELMYITNNEVGRKTPKKEMDLDLIFNDVTRSARQWHFLLQTIMMN